MRTVSDVLVLCYHAVAADWPADLAVTPPNFERQVVMMQRRGYRGATFHDAVTHPPWPKTLAITFDDAFRSVFAYAFPLLAGLDVPATVFVPTRHVATGLPMAWAGIDRWVGGAYEHELVGMSWEELETLAQAGWEIGSHTRTHPHLTRLADDELARELRGSRDDCEARLGMRCVTLAYPYGDLDARVVAAAADAGYVAACELSRRLAPAGPLRFPRVGVYHRDGIARFWLKASRAVRGLRAIGFRTR